jgi:hypothetical protein
MVKRGRPKLPKDLEEAMRELIKLRAEVASAEVAARQHAHPLEPEIESLSSSREGDPDEDQIA